MIQFGGIVRKGNSIHIKVIEDDLFCRWGVLILGRRPIMDSEMSLKVHKKSGLSTRSRKFLEILK